MVTGRLARGRAQPLAIVLILASSLTWTPTAYAQIVEYYGTDAVGNVRVVVDQTGNLVERHDYLPFGEECATGPCAGNPGLGAGQPRKFTGKERDAETGLDYFGARYYGPSLGRFTTVDPNLSTQEALVRPQKWNRYTYSLDNPLRYVDPDGREEITITINAFIPHAFVTSPWPMKGDNRDLFESGTSRTTHRIVVETDARKDPDGLVSEASETGVSLGLGRNGILTTGQAPTEGLKVNPSRDASGDVQVHATGNAKYPNLWVPDWAAIQYDFNLRVSDRNGQVVVTVTGKHSRFPGFEIMSQREGSTVKQPVYGRVPGRSQAAPMRMMLPNQSVDERKMLKNR